MSSPVNLATPVSFTQDIDIMELAERKLMDILDVKEVSMFCRMINNEDDEVKALKPGQLFFSVGITNSDDTTVKTYLKAKGILKSETSDYFVIELDGNTYPLVITKECIFKLYAAPVKRDFTKKNVFSYISSLIQRSSK